MNNLCCIIILNLNGKEFTKNCLNSIKKNTYYKNYKVIVVDNNSSDGSQNLIKSKFKWIDLIENENNRGFSGGNNDGIKYALKKYNPDYFYLLNNDTIVTKNWLLEALKTIEKSKEIGIVGSKQLTFDKKPAISAGKISMFGVKYYYGNKEKEVNWVSGASLLIKREVINKIGFLDERYSPVYYEETDFEFRAKKYGFKIIINPNSIIFHKGGGTSTNLDLNFIFYRNRFVFFIKNYGLFFFIPRMISDIIKSIKLRKFHSLIKAYKEGRKLLK